MAVKFFTKEDKEKFLTIVKHRFLDSLPEFIAWKDKTIEVDRGRLLDFSEDDFVAYKEKYKDSAPAWVFQVKNLYIFRNKVLRIDDFIQDVVGTAMIAKVMAEYCARRDGKFTEKSEQTQAAPTLVESATLSGAGVLNSAVELDDGTGGESDETSRADIGGETASDIVDGLLDDR